MDLSPTNENGRTAKVLEKLDGNESTEKTDTEVDGQDDSVVAMDRIVGYRMSPLYFRILRRLLRRFRHPFTFCVHSSSQFLVYETSRG